MRLLDRQEEFAKQKLEDLQDLSINESNSIVDEQIELDRKSNQLDEDRKKFTLAAIKMGKERAQLQVI